MSVKIINDLKLDFKDVLIRPKRSEAASREDVDLTRVFTTRSGQTIKGCPIIAANMDTTGSLAMAQSLSKYGCFTALHKHYSQLEKINFFAHSGYCENTFYSMGIGDTEYHEFGIVYDMVANEGGCVKLLCMDVANGYSEKFSHVVSKVRENYPNIVIMAGNVVTTEMTEALLMAGADIVKIGIGPGSACTTRVKTGVGYPQLSAILECSDAAHGMGGLICADGGCTRSGDIAKAFGADADFVMLGGMLAGTDECEGEWEYKSVGYNREEKSALKFYGMSSKEAQEKHNGGVASYRAAEGKCVTVPYKGHVKEVIQDIQGGLRSAGTYMGADSLKNFGKCCTFIRVTQQENTVFS